MNLRFKAPLLVQLSTEREHGVLIALLGSLQQFVGDNDVAEALAVTATTGDISTPVRLEAFRMIARSHPGEPSVLDAAEQLLANSPSDDLADEAIGHVTETADHSLRAKELLLRYVDYDRTEQMRDRVRGRVRELAYAGDEVITEGLVRTLAEGTSVARELAARLIGEIASVSAPIPLGAEPTLRIIPDDQVRELALELIERLRRGLSRLEDDPDLPPEVRELATSALGILDDLRRLLSDGFPTRASLRAGAARGRSLFSKLGGILLGTIAAGQIVVGYVADTPVAAERIQGVIAEIRAEHQAVNEQLAPVLGEDAPLPAGEP